MKHAPLDPTDLDAIFRFLGIDPDEPDEPDDPPENLDTISRSEWINMMTITPPPAIQRYLDSGDPLTHHTLEMMELAIEKHHNITAPWSIVANREGDEAEGTLRLTNFMLLHDPEATP